MEQANIVLSCMGKQKFERIADLLIEMRTTASRQVQEWQQQRQAGQPALDLDPSPVPGSVAKRPNGPEKRADA
jgi:hypothetical protein